MQTVVSRDGTEIAYESLGSGPAVVLVDGAMCFRDAGPMRPLAERLADDFTVVFYDRRGRGDSGDTHPFAVEREIEDLDAVISAAGGSAAIYGMSSGGALAVLSAAVLGSRIRALVLYEPPYVTIEGRDAALAYAARLDEVLADGRRGDAVELFMTRVGMPPEMIAGARRSPAWSGMEAIAHTLAYDAAVLGDSMVPREVASQVSQPALVVDGGSSPFMDTAAAQIATALPNGSRVTLDAQTHDVAPEVMAPVIAGFLKSAEIS